MTETSESRGFVLRLLRKGVGKSRYVRSGDEYLPSFEAADAMAGWFQQASVPFTLQANQFLIKTELPSWRFVADFMSLVGTRSPTENATSCVVIIWLLALEVSLDGPVTAKLLCEKIGFSKSTISKIVNHLLNVGYLNRQRDRFDERCYRLSLILCDDYRVAVQVLFSRYLSICD